jgi:hypothetical protein
MAAPYVGSTQWAGNGPCPGRSPSASRRAWAPRLDAMSAPRIVIRSAGRGRPGQSMSMGCDEAVCAVSQRGKGLPPDEAPQHRRWLPAVPERASDRVGAVSPEAWPHILHRRRALIARQPEGREVGALPCDDREGTVRPPPQRRGTGRAEAAVTVEDEDGARPWAGPASRCSSHVHHDGWIRA